MMAVNAGVAQVDAEALKAVEVLFEDAGRLERARDPMGAYDSLKKAAHLMKQVMTRQHNPHDRAQLTKKIGETMDHMERLKAEPAKSAHSSTGGAFANAEALVDTMEERSATRVTLEDVKGLDEAKRTIRECFVWPRQHPSAFKHRGAIKWSGLILYGPPGTGKTHFARAVATEFECTFFNATVSTIIQMWQGESEKVVRVLFERARSKAPSVIFIDEVDALCSARGSATESESARRVKTELITQMDGMRTSSESNILVMGATNRLYELDDALGRRFQRKIYVPLPNFETRVELIKVFTELEKEEHRGRLAELTEGFSGSGIETLSSLASSVALEEYMQSEWLEPDLDFDWAVPGPHRLASHTCACEGVPPKTPCPECGWMRASIHDFPDGFARPPVPELRHFEEALRRRAGEPFGGVGAGEPLGAGQGAG